MSTNNTPSVLLIGGTGFLGKHLALKFLSLGYFVKIVSRNTAELVIKSDHLIHYQYDIEKNVPWDEITQDIETVFFLYSPNIPRDSINMIREDLSLLNEIGTNILDSCVKNGVNTICFPSSGGAIYGMTSDEVINEQVSTNPISNYGLTKLVFEKLLIIYQYHHGLNYLIFRLSNVYGPFQNLNKPQGVISHWLKNIIEGRVIEIWGDGLVRRDYIYIDDAIEAMILATESKIRNEIYNLGFGKSYHLMDIIRIIETTLNLSIKYQHVSNNKSDVKNATLDVSKFKTTFNWQPKRSIEVGTALTYNFLTERI